MTLKDEEYGSDPNEPLLKKTHEEKESKVAKVFSIIGRILMVLILLFFMFGIIWLFTHRKLLHQILDKIHKLGLYGNLIMIGIFIVVALPVSTGYTVLCLACGFMYGIWKGWLTSWIGVVLGSNMCYWLCRTLGKNWVEKKIKNNKKIDILMRAVKKNSFKIVFMMRLTPVPYGLQNAIFSISGISFFPSFSVATALGMIPEGIMWTYLGSTARELESIIDGKANFGKLEKVIFGLQISAAVILFVSMIFLGRRVLKRAMAEEEKNYVHILQSAVDDQPSDETIQ